MAESLHPVEHDGHYGEEDGKFWICEQVLAFPSLFPHSHAACTVQKLSQLQRDVDNLFTEMSSMKALLKEYISILDEQYSDDHSITQERVLEDESQCNGKEKNSGQSMRNSDPCPGKPPHTSCLVRFSWHPASEGDWALTEVHPGSSSSTQYSCHRAWEVYLHFTFNLVFRLPGEKGPLWHTLCMTVSFSHSYFEIFKSTDILIFF